MAIQFVTTTLQGFGVGINLATNDEILVTATGQILEQNEFATGILLNGGNDVTILGLVGGGRSAVQTPFVAPVGGNTVTIGTTGIAFGMTGSSTILLSSGTGDPANVLNNAGLITANRASAVELYGDGSRLTNSGRIVAQDSGVIFGAAGGTVLNSGTIEAGVAGIYSVSGDVFLANSGTIGGAQYGIWVQTGSNVRVENDGVITGATGIRLGQADIGSGANNVVVVNTGTIQSDGVGLDIFGVTPTLINAGIMGTARMGAYGARVDNTGSILGGVAFTGASDSYTRNTLSNTGTITAGGINESSTAAIYGSAIAEIVVNAGTIRGGIDLGGGFDAYDGTLGLTLGYIDGGLGNDTLLGGRAGETISGGSGADVILGGEGGDQLYGGNDADLLDGGAGNDFVDGGVGADADTLAGGEGNDTLYDPDANNLFDGGAGHDSISDGIGSSTIYGGDGNDRLLAGGGNDLADGEAGQDLLEGGTANDTLMGGTGDDILRPGAGVDVIDGGEGLRDMLDYAGSAAVNVNLGLGEASGGDAQGDDFTGIEWLAGSGFNDVLTGDALANSLFGRGGNDLLVGGIGNDNLWGEAGADTLNGGAGVDVMRGGIGADVFRFITPAESGAPGQVRDRILDFSRTELDRIDLAFIDANSALAGNQAFAFIAGAAFTAAGQLRFEVIGGNTFVFGNTDATLGASEFSIMLVGSVALAATDFIL